MKDPIKGEERGRIEGRKAQALETAKTLLEMNLPIEKIVKATGLTAAEILQLKNGS